MISPKYALLNDLDQSRFHEERGIGGPGQCVKIFDNHTLALQFAVSEIVSRPEYEDDDSDPTPEQILEDFQDGLGGLEYFHLREVVE